MNTVKLRTESGHVQTLNVEIVEIDGRPYHAVDGDMHDRVLALETRLGMLEQHFETLLSAAFGGEESANDDDEQHEPQTE